jgi:hypothetical protein
VNRVHGGVRQGKALTEDTPLFGESVRPPRWLQYTGEGGRRQQRKRRRRVPQVLWG